MADYYTKFCVVLPNLTKDEAAWMSRALDNIDTMKDDEDGTAAAHLGLGDLHEQLWLSGYGYHWGIEADTSIGRDGELDFIFSDDEGQPNIDALLELVRAFLAKFRPASIFAVEWSYDCSASRPDAYGGGVGWATSKETGCIGTADLRALVINRDFRRLKELLP